MKNIAIITQSLLSGGSEKQSVFLANALCHKYSIYLIVLKGNEIEQKFLELLNTDEVNLIRLKRGLIKNIITVYKIYKQRKILISFSYLASGNFVNSIAGLLARVKYRIGGIRNALLQPQKIPFEKFFHNYLLTKTVSNSHKAVSALSKKGFNKEKFHVIHNTFLLSQKEIYRPATKIINIISIARFVPQKDHFTALKAIAILKERLTHSKSKLDFKYFLIGYGEQESQIRKWVKDLGIDDKVKIVIKPDNLDEYYKKADIFLTTSIFEGLSNSVMEAMSFSLPVVATPAGDMEYLVNHGLNGYIIKMGDVEGIADKLNILITQYDLRIKMGLKSYRILSENFSMKKFKKEYLILIDSLLNGK